MRFGTLSRHGRACAGDLLKRYFGVSFRGGALLRAEPGIHNPK